MSKSLVIVESPAKAKTINKYLGTDFDVEASLGHVKDLPKNRIAVDFDHDFETELVVIPGKEKVLDALRKKAAKANAIFLAPDPDREGEAIAAHLFEELGGSRDKKGKYKYTGAEIRRVTFNEITQKAVKAAFEHPRDIDWNLVDAQQTRRVLDRIVGYQISPLLWDKVRRGLSAGRVQTVALRLIVERERAIKAFIPVESWTIGAHLSAAQPPAFDARFIGIDGEKLEVPNQQQADLIVEGLAGAAWTVAQVKKTEVSRKPFPPFTTAKLQQDAFQKLHFSSKRTMALAQRLYEGIELGTEGSIGLITYMRTDSTQVSTDALAEVREIIAASYGKEFIPSAPNVYKSKSDAQGAHEAIRPTSAARHPDQVQRYMQEDEFKLYRLIWQRFVASQMVPALFDRTTVDIAAQAVNGKRYDYRVTGTVLKFEGFLKAYDVSKDARDEEDDELKRKLPPLEEGQKLTLKALKPEQHFSEPPPRFNDGTLVKVLEERGIGRPSTYAAILSTIQERQYVTKTGGKAGKFVPTEIGMVVCDLLVVNFPYIFDPDYTAKLEQELDSVEDGTEKWTTLMGDFYQHFEKELRHAEIHMENVKRMEKPTDQVCEKCGSPLVLKWGKFGSFYACSTYDKKDPDSCNFTKENVIDLPDLETADTQDTAAGEEYCPNCNRVMVLKRGRFGQFMACTGYPDCKTTRQLTATKATAPIPLDEKCPKCDRNLVLRTGRFGEFVACSGYPKCKYVKQNFIGVTCPKCGEGEIAEKKARRGNLFYGCSEYPKCDFTSNNKPIAEQCPQCGSAYLVQKDLKSGTVLVCPNNKKSVDEEKPKRGRKKVAGEVAPAVVKCDYSRPAPELTPVPVEQAEVAQAVQ
ncbi:MAG: type I DNA topoisomerase [Acidobacteriaceae bacterium]